MEWKPYADAFEAAGISTPAEVIRDRGLIIAHYSSFKFADINGKIGITEIERSAIYNGINLKSQATTIFERPGSIISIWKDTAFKGGEFSIDEVVPHEMIHGSSVGRHYSLLSYVFLFYGHDLTGYEHYQKIIDNCQFSSEKK